MTTYFQHRLRNRVHSGNYRSLEIKPELIDFASNDTFGISKELQVYSSRWGSTGSRLLTGNSREAEKLEIMIAEFHGVESAILFNCGYMANMGLLSTIAHRNDHILFDSDIHTSTREGIRLSDAKAYHFKHNHIDDLERLLRIPTTGSVYICVESIYSCDGSRAPLKSISELCHKYNAALIIDEAHSNGIYPTAPIHAFARVVTYSKAFGLMGAAVLCDGALKEYLINFCKPLIYSTALPYPILEGIRTAYDLMPSLEMRRKKLYSLIEYFQSSSGLYLSDTHIQAIPTSDAKAISKQLEREGFDVRALLCPTVLLGKECLRICLHSFNTENQIKILLKNLEKILC